MTNNIQTPLDFDVKTVINKMEISYDNVIEIEDGSPVVGLLLLNKKLIGDYLFGGPLLHHQQCLYAPAYIRKPTGWGFKLAQINMVNFEVKVFGEIKGLIFLDKIEGGKVYYFNNLEKTSVGFYEL